MPSLELIQSFIAPQVILFLLFGGGALATALTMLFHPNPIRSALFLVLNLFCVAVLYLLLNAYFLAAVQIVVYAGAIMVLFLFVIMLLNLGTPDRTVDRLRYQQPLAVVGGLVLAGVVAATLASTTHLPALDANGNPPAARKPSGGAMVAARAEQISVPGDTASSGAAPAPLPAGSETLDQAAARGNLPETPAVSSADQGTVAGVGKVLYNPDLPYLFPFEVTSILLLVATIGSVVLAKRRMPGETQDIGEIGETN